jgi:hypothetical protein
MIAPSGNIGTFHRALEQGVASILGYATRVDAVATSWKLSGEGRLVMFHLFPRTGTTTYADRVVGSLCPVLPMYAEEAIELEATVWVGWQEEWVSRGDRRFELIGAAWAFFWGYQTSRQQQLFRADWDNTGRRGGRSAQPHWHFDRRLVAEVYRARRPADPIPYEHRSGPKQVEDEDLVELAGVDVLQDLSMSSLHLGMGGWTNPGSDHECWQRSPDTLASLNLWASSTLQYTKAQFENLKRGESVSV